jgi:hypothetical protein
VADALTRGRFDDGDRHARRGDDRQPEDVGRERVDRRDARDPFDRGFARVHRDDGDLRLNIVAQDLVAVLRTLLRRADDGVGSAREKGADSGSRFGIGGHWGRRGRRHILAA